MSEYVPLTYSLIVEGYGEVSAVPVLLRRIAESHGAYIEVTRPIRLDRSKISKEAELVRAVTLASVRAGQRGSVLILLDGDDDCPVQLADRIRALAAKANPSCPVHVVVAVREYESLFLCTLKSLAAKNLTHQEYDLTRAPESIRGAKEEMRKALRSGVYKETQDQTRLTAQLDIEEALKACRWFRKLHKCVSESLTD